MALDKSSSSASGPVERAFALLQAVVAAGSPVGVRELGRRTGLPRSTTSRLIAQLNQLGMVERTGDGLVVPGSALATLAIDGDAPALLRDQLRPLLSALVDGYHENVALAIDDGDAVLYIAQLDSSNTVTAPDVRAERHPFHVVAHGLALMAYWPTERLEQYLRGPLVGPTGASLTDPEKLRLRLSDIRRVGYVWTIEEFDREVNGLAVTIISPGNEAGPAESVAAIASVGFYGPSYRLSPQRCPGLAADLISQVADKVPALI